MKTSNMQIDLSDTSYEKGFEDGYAMARRLYEPYAISITTESGLPVKKLLRSKKSHSIDK